MSRRRRSMRLKTPDVGRIINKIIKMVLSLYVGGVTLTTFGNVMVNKTSALFTPLEFIGWTVNSTGTITATDSSNSILSVVGLAGFANIISDFVAFS